MSRGGWSPRTRWRAWASSVSARWRRERCRRTRRRPKPRRLASTARATRAKAIKLLLNSYPYTDAMLMNIENFNKLTVIDRHLRHQRPRGCLLRQSDDDAVEQVERDIDAFMTCGPDMAAGRTGRLARRISTSSSRTRPPPRLTGTWPTFSRAAAFGKVDRKAGRTTLGPNGIAVRASVGL